MSTANIRFLSWNVRGIHAPIKRTKIINHLHKLQADICLLQETHLLETEHKKLLGKYFNRIYSSSFNSKKRGVAILVHKNVQLIHKKTISDTQGRYIIIQITINNKDITIANIYGPNTDDPAFYHDLFTILSDFSNSPLVIGGDFNTVLNLEQDRLNSNAKIWRTTKMLQQYMEDFGLGDIWRLQHPSVKEYTYFSQVHHSFSRIDLFLASNSIIQHISQSTIHPIVISDHAPITFSFKDIEKKTATRPRWRFNTSLITDKEFDAYFKREWTSFMVTNDLQETSPILLWETSKAVMRGKIISYSVHKKKKDQEKQSSLDRKSVV